MKSESTEKAWKCSHCPREFKYESDRRRHELSHVPQFECKRCCKKFSFLSALRRHEKQHERKGGVQCSQCGGTFRDEVLLKRHMRYSHKGAYECDKCSAVLSSEPALRTHMKTHAPESERRFRCTFGCGKTFNFSHHLRHHEMTHTNSKQHFCQTCGKGFIQSTHLKTHEKSHEPDSWLPCTVTGCQKKFVDKYARKRHLATHRKTRDAGSSSDSSAVPSKTSALEESQDGERHQTRRKSIVINTSGRHIIVECKSTKKQTTVKTEIINPLFIVNSRYDIDNHDDNYDDPDNNYVDDGINTCKTAIGSCLVTGDSKINANCLCAQINNTVDETEEFILPCNNETLTVDNSVMIANHKGVKVTPIVSLQEAQINNTIDETDEFILPSNNETLTGDNTVMNANDKAVKVTPIVSLQEDYGIEDYENLSNKCEGCECANLCSITDKIACNKDAKIEYIPGGIVKLKDTYDFDFKPSVQQDDRTKNASDESNGEISECRPSNFKSCKDVIGNCIVSGNSTIGEGCLCARMMADDQAMAEEIDEITPCPQS